MSTKKTAANRQVLLLNSKMSKTIKSRTIYGAKHIVIEACGSIVCDAVMNGVLYPKDEVISLAANTTGDVVVPFRHPEDEQGNFISALSAQGIHQNYIGAHAYNFRMDGDLLVCDIAIDPEVASRTEKGQRVLDRIEAGEDIDMSTGLVLYVEEAEGYGKDGEPYQYIASNMTLDHFAILDEDEPGAATSDEGVGMFTNADGGESSVSVAYAVNASTPASRLPVDYGEFDEQEAIEAIKAYTGSEQTPSRNYRKFFLEFDREEAGTFEAYKKPFVVMVDGVPHASAKAIEQYAKEGFEDGSRAAAAVAAYTAKIAEHKVGNSLTKTAYNKFVAFVEKLITFNYNEREHEENSVSETNNGDRIMRELILNALKDAGVETEGLDESQLLAAYNKLNAPAESNENIGALVAEAVNSAVKPLNEKIEALETANNAEAEAEKTALATQVEGLNIGINKDAALAMGVDGMKSVIAANSGKVRFNANSSFDGNVDSEKSALDIVLGN